MTAFIPNRNHFYGDYFKAFLSFKRKILLQLSSCDLCGQHCQHYLLLCTHCYHNLPKFYYHKVQGDLLNWPEINSHLPNIHFDHLIALAPHDTPYQSWLSQLKYQGRFELAPLLGELLATNYQNLLQQYRLALPDLITCVPIHIKRWQARGFNQSHLISKQLVKNINTNKPLLYCPNLIKRNSHAIKQVGQSGRERRKSLKNAFCLTAITSLPKHVMLIDDVVTTGSTASEISRLLKQNGVEKITLMTVTIALSKQSTRY